jgi:hypothetical protein
MAPLRLAEPEREVRQQPRTPEAPAAGAALGQYSAICSLSPRIAEWQAIRGEN